MEDNLSMDWEVGRGGFRMIQMHYICCAFYFYDFYISSTLDPQALDQWGPLVWEKAEDATVLGSEGWVVCRHQWNSLRTYHLVASPPRFHFGACPLIDHVVS